MFRTISRTQMNYALKLESSQNPQQFKDNASIAARQQGDHTFVQDVQRATSKYATWPNHIIYMARQFAPDMQMSSILFPSAVLKNSR
jgi:hypothetical protein